MKLTTTIKPAVDLASGVITLDVLEISDQPVDNVLNSMLSKHYRDVLDTKERAVRDALILLGWTPPPEAAVLHSARGDTPTGA